MRCEDNINFHLSFDKFRKNDCWSDISHSLSFSKIFFNPFKPEYLSSKSSSINQAANDCQNPKLSNEDNINLYLSFDKFRKNDCWSDISHSRSFSKIFLNPFKPEFIIKIVIHYKPQVTVRILNCQIFSKRVSQPPSSRHPAVSQPASLKNPSYFYKCMT